MNSARLSDWLQVIGLFGVIASLVFVGLQMMQDREIALSAIYQERAAAAAEFYVARASIPENREALAKMQSGGSLSLTTGEMIAFQSIALAGKQMIDNSHYQWEQGFASDEHWRQIRETWKSALRNPVAREVYVQSPMRPSFRLEYTEILREIESESPSE